MQGVLWFVKITLHEQSLISNTSAIVDFLRPFFYLRSSGSRSTDYEKVKKKVVQDLKVV